MRSLQNIILVLWAVVLLLFLAFNWQLVWRPLDFNILFMDFQMRLLFWPNVVALVAAAFMSLLGAMETRSLQRRMSQSMDKLSAHVHSERSKELEELLGRVEGRFKEMLGKLPAESTKSGAAKSSQD